MPVSINIRPELLVGGAIQLNIQGLGMTGSFTIYPAEVHEGTCPEKTCFLKEPTGGPKPSQKNLRKAVTRQERQLAEHLGGYRQSGSGSKPGAKGDGLVLDLGVIAAQRAAPGLFRIENKLTTAESFTVKLSSLRKIRAECQGRETPLYNIQFIEKGTHRVLEDWTMVPTKEWLKSAIRNNSGPR